MSDFVGRAVEVMRDRLSAIERERSELERALASLGHEKSPQRRARPQRGSAPRKARESDTGRAAAVAEYLAANPDAPTATVIEALGLSDGRVVGAQRRRLRSAPAEPES